MPRRTIYIKNPTQGSHFRTLDHGGPLIEFARDAFDQIMGFTNKYIGPQKVPYAPTTHKTTPKTRPVNIGLSPNPEIHNKPFHIDLPQFIFANPFSEEAGAADLADWKGFFSELTLPEFETPALFLIFHSITGPNMNSYDPAVQTLQDRGFTGDIPPQDINTNQKNTFQNVKSNIWHAFHDTGLAPGERLPGDNPKLFDTLGTGPAND